MTNPTDEAVDPRLTYRVQDVLERLAPADRVMAERGRGGESVKVDQRGLREETAELLTALPLSDREAVRSQAQRAVEEALGIAEEFVAPTFEAANVSVSAVWERAAECNSEDEAEPFSVGAKGREFAYASPKGLTWASWIEALKQELIRASSEAVELGNELFVAKHKLEAIDWYLNSPAGKTPPKPKELPEPTSGVESRVPLRPYGDISPDARDHAKGRRMPPAAGWLTIGRAIVNVHDSVNYTSKDRVYYIREVLDNEMDVEGSELGRYVKRKGFDLTTFNEKALSRVMKAHEKGTFGPPGQPD